MKTLRLVIILLLLSGFGSTRSYAQEDWISIHTDQEYQEQFQKLVEELRLQLNQLADSSSTFQQRSIIESLILAKFIGNGKSYYEIDEYGDSILMEPVKVQLSYPSGFKRYILLTTFLGKQEQLSKPWNYTIDAIDVIRCCEYRIISDGHYQVFAYSRQEMTKPQFCTDYPYTKLIMNFKPNRYFDALTEGIILGNIYVTATKRNE